MQKDDLPHYPSQRDRDDAAAGAGLIVIFVLSLVFTLGVVVGFVIHGLLFGG